MRTFAAVKNLEVIAARYAAHLRWAFFMSIRLRYKRLPFALYLRLLAMGTLNSLTKRNTAVAFLCHKVQ